MRVLLIVLRDDVKTKASSFKCYQEIEDRAPTIQRQRDDHEKAVETVANLTTQLDLSVQQCDSEKQKYFEAHRLFSSCTDSAKQSEVRKASGRFEQASNLPDPRSRRAPWQSNARRTS